MSIDYEKYRNQADKRQEEDRERSRIELTDEEKRMIEMVPTPDEFLPKEYKWYQYIYKPRLWFGWTDEKQDALELLEESPIMLYIDENLDAKFIRNVVPGTIDAKDKDGKKTGGVNLIEARKLCRLHYGNAVIPLYVNYSKERYGYPIEVVFDAKEYEKAIRLMQMSYKEYDESQSLFGNLKWDKILMYGAIAIGIIMGALWVGKIFGIWDLLGWFQPQAVATAITNATSNITSNMTATINATQAQAGAIVIQ